MKEATASRAESVSQQNSTGLVGSLTPIALMMLMFYFLIIRPHQKRETKRRNLINSIKRGDKILTSSGIIGVLHKIVNENEILLEISENLRIRMLKNSITEVLDKASEVGTEEVDVSCRSTDETKPEKKKVPGKKRGSAGDV